MSGNLPIRARRHAFTLVEILIVVVILAILAAAIIPQFMVSTTDAKEAVMMQNLNTLRTQVGAYRVQHGGLAPTADVADQLTQKTNVDGTTTGSPTFGPYLLLIPPNPATLDPNLQTTISVVTTDPTANTTTEGWIYNSVNGRFYSATDYLK
jgi:general secretion pathway protein G